MEADSGQLKGTRAAVPPAVDEDLTGGEAGAPRVASSLERAFEQAPAAMAVLTGPDLIYSAANARFRALAGGRQLIGRPLRQAHPNASTSAFHGEEFIALLEAVYTSGRTHAPVALRVQAGPAGQQASVYLDVAATALRDAAGQVEDVLVHAYDLTEHRRAEEASARLVAIVESSDDAIISKDLDGVIQSWNRGAEHMFGYTADEAVGRTVTMLMPPDRIDEEPVILARIRSREPVDHYETVRRRKDGSLLNISLSVSPIFDAAGRVIGASKIARDITERRIAEDERERLLAAEREARRAAEEASRAREEFLSIASHELRNPVAALRGTAQLMRRANANGRLTEGRLETYLDTLEASGAHLATLTEDLLDVSRLQRGELPLRPEQTDLARLLVHLVRQGEWPTERFLLEVEHEGIETVLDPDRIAQVIRNLLDNAVKYSPEDESVHVRLRADGGGLLLEVQDAGIGLPSDALESIFTPFGRAPNAAAANIPGLGLGLYVARRIAQQHGGRLWAQSEGEGKGTLMSLWLPLSGEQQAAS